MARRGQLNRNTTKTDLQTSSEQIVSVRQVCLNVVDGVAKTVLSGYFKYGVQTLLTGNFGTTGTIIVEIYGNTEDTSGDEEGVH